MYYNTISICVAFLCIYSSAFVWLMQLMLKKCLVIWHLRNGSKSKTLYLKHYQTKRISNILIFWSDLHWFSFICICLTWRVFLICNTKTPPFNHRSATNLPLDPWQKRVDVPFSTVWPCVSCRHVVDHYSTTGLPQFYQWTYGRNGWIFNFHGLTTCQWKTHGWPPFYHGSIIMCG